MDGYRSSLRRLGRSTLFVLLILLLTALPVSAAYFACEISGTLPAQTTVNQTDYQVSPDGRYAIFLTEGHPDLYSSRSAEVRRCG
jgi:hypothetical protein